MKFCLSFYSLAFVLVILFGISLNSDAQTSILYEDFEDEAAFASRWKLDAPGIYSWIIKEYSGSSLSSKIVSGDHYLYNNSAYQYRTMICDSIILNDTNIKDAKLVFWHYRRDADDDLNLLVSNHYRTLTGKYDSVSSKWISDTVDLAVYLINLYDAVIYIQFRGSPGSYLEDIRVLATMNFDVQADEIISDPSWYVGKRYLRMYFSNVGLDTLDSITLNYQLDTDAVVSEPFQLHTPLPPGTTKAYFFNQVLDIKERGFHKIKAWTSKPNGKNYDNFPANDTIKSSFCAGIYDTFVIDINGNGDLKTISDAVELINSCDVLDTVVFLIKPGIYHDSVYFEENSSVDEYSRIFFIGEHQDSVIITSYSGYTFTVDGADFLTFENLTVRSKGMGCFRFFNRADYNTIRNCKLYGDTASYYVYLILASQDEDYYGYGKNANHLTIENNFISGGRSGVRLVSVDNSSVDSNNRICNNLFVKQYGTSISVACQKKVCIEHNKITDKIESGGIYLNQCSGSSVRSNIIHNSGLGIRAENWYEHDTSFIENNMISLFKEMADGGHGIFLISSMGVNCFHNSVSLNDSTSSTSYVLLTDNLYGLNQIKNNIFQSVNYAHLVWIRNSQNLQLDHNIYHYPYKWKTKFRVGLNSYYYNFEDFKADTSFGVHDENSYDDIDPNFVSMEDLHIQDQKAGYTGLFVGVMTDIDGDSHCIAKPTIGADYVPLPYVVSGITTQGDTFCQHAVHIFAAEAYDYNDYEWYLDGNFISSDAYTARVFHDTGSYLIRLITRNCNGIDTSEKLIYVDTPKVRPYADFGADKLHPVVNGEWTRLSNQSIGCTDAWQWKIWPDKFVAGPGYADTSTFLIFFTDTVCYDIKLVAAHGSYVDSITKPCFILPQCKPGVDVLDTATGIVRVELGDIDKSSGVQAYSSFYDSIGCVLKTGGNYPLTITRPAHSKDVSINVWIDYNEDDDFNDSFELVVSDSHVNNQIFTDTLYIPAWVKAGTKRLRISSCLAGHSNTYCGSIYSGEFEDYKLEILPGDFDPPVITIKGLPIPWVDQCTDYFDAGATAWDSVDGNLTKKIVTESNVNTQVRGGYEVTYTVSDNSNNVAKAVRLVYVPGETNQPELTLLGSKHITIPVHSVFDDPGYTATDDCSGLDTVLVTSLSTNYVGEFSIIYIARDYNYNYKRVYRYINIIDTIAPVISYPGGDTFYIESPDTIIDPDVIATDNYDSFVPLIKSGSYYDDYLSHFDTGTYYIFYHATDSSGNQAVSKKRVVMVSPVNGIMELPEFLKVYPNPFGDYIVIKSLWNWDDAGYSLQNVMGQTLREQKCFNQGGSCIIRTENLHPGIYMLKLHYGSECYSIKLVKAQ